MQASMRKINNISLIKYGILLILLPILTQRCTKTAATDFDRPLMSAPSYALESTTGKRFGSDQFAGKYVVLHIATTWCPYCNAEAPHLQSLFENYRGRGVEVVIIDVKESGDLVHEKLVERFGLTFPVLLDHEGAVAASFAPADVLPELARDEIMLASNLLIDPEGTIQFMSLLDTKNFDVELTALRAQLDDLLAAAH
ncbi:MAG: TlpA disulfide reductase family protein [Bacteroidota bacterium]